MLRWGGADGQTVANPDLLPQKMCEALQHAGIVLIKDIRNESSLEACK